MEGVSRFLICTYMYCCIVYVIVNRLLNGFAKHTRTIYIFCSSLYEFTVREKLRTEEALVAIFWATNSQVQALATHCVDYFYYIQALLNCLL